MGAVNLTPAAGQPTTSSSDSTSLPSPTVAAVVTAVVNTPLPAVTAGPIVKPAAYTLHEGEFPYCLARRYNVNPDELLTLNGISSTQSYYTPGTKITIPQSGGTFPGQRSLKTHPTQYTVLAGDTIYSVACSFGDVDPLGIVSANGLSGTYSLTAGSAIQIP